MGALTRTVDNAGRYSAHCETPVMLDAGQFWCTERAEEVSTDELTLADIHAPLVVGTGVDLYFELAGIFAIETRGVVVRVEGSRATIRFLDLDDDAQRALESYVSGAYFSSTRIRQRPLAAN